MSHAVIVIRYVQTVAYGFEICVIRLAFCAFCKVGRLVAVLVLNRVYGIYYNISIVLFEVFEINAVSLAHKTAFDAHAYLYLVPIFFF